MPRGIPNKPKDAKNTPVILTKGIEASEQVIGQVGVQLVQPATRMPDAEKAANMAFMEEKVTIRVGTSSDQNAEQMFELNINGDREFFRRGETKTVKRYFVDHMARTKSTAYKDREVFNNEGVKQFLHEPTSALKYDFQMVRDDSPHGESWLKHTLAMAA
jgi:hypothetical protein